MSTKPYFLETGSSTAVLVKANLTWLHSMEVENPNTTQVYIQLFDAKAVSDVTVGTTTPDQTYVVPAGDGTDNGAKIKDYSDPLRFHKGLVFAVTTTATGNGDPSSECPVNFTYQ